MGVEIYRGHHFLEFKDPRNLPGMQYVKGIFRGAIKPLKRYSITGYIRFDYQFRWFTLNRPPPGDAKILRQAILDADEAAPWKEDTCQSIRYLGPGAWVDCQSNETYIFQIAPPNEVMTQAQMYAYEKYLAVLADTLATQKIDGVESVLYGLEASTSQRFMVPGLSPR